MSMVHTCHVQSHVRKQSRHFNVDCLCFDLLGVSDLADLAENRQQLGVLPVEAFVSHVSNMEVKAITEAGQQPEPYVILFVDRCT